MTDAQLRERYERQKEYVKEYNKKHYDVCTFVLKKDDSIKLKKYLKDRNISLNKFIKDFILNEIE